MVPLATSPWKPEIAPQAMVMKSSGNQPGASAGSRWLIAGATTAGWTIRTPAKITASATKSWWLLM